MYNEELAKKVMKASCEVFNCTTSKVCGYQDTEEKKIIVYILFKMYDMCRFSIGKQFFIPHLYIRTVASEVEDRFLLDHSYRDKIIQILTKVKYESNLDIQRIGAA